VRIYLIIVLIGVFAGSIRAAEPASTEAMELFNGRDLTGWDVYVEGDTVSAEQAWKVDSGTLRATGEGRGYVRTKQAFADYHLKLEWRWPKDRGNSGIMLHIVGDDLLWPKSFEAQLQTDRAGDFNSFSDARSQEEIVSRNPRGVSTGRLPRPGGSQEKPLGEWNTYEAICAGDAITLLVNGVEVNRMTGVIPSGGMIGLQSEGSAIEFRNITLTPLPPAKDLHAPMPE
jgi:hypothetical protein